MLLHHKYGRENESTQGIIGGVGNFLSVILLEFKESPIEYLERNIHAPI